MNHTHNLTPDSRRPASRRVEVARLHASESAIRTITGQLGKELATIEHATAPTRLVGEAREEIGGGEDGDVAEGAVRVARGLR